MKTFHSFKDTQSFQKFLRSGKYPKCHKSGCLDYVKVGGILYTEHEYDMDGKEMSWANKKHNVRIDMCTFNRYENYDDALVYFIDEPSYLRNDISYAQ